MARGEGERKLHDRAELPDVDVGKNFYVYGLYDEDEIFYVGKGKGRRYKSHFPESCLSKKSYKNSKIKKINREGRKVIVKIIAKNLTEKEALLLEGKLIEDFGTRDNGGVLTNVYAGNWHQTRDGYVFPEERKESQSIALRGKNGKVTEELVLKAKLLVHYMGKSYQEISELPEYEGLSREAVKGWCNKTNYSYLRPDLKSHFEIRDEQMEECYALWKKGFKQQQVADIFGLKLSMVKSLIQKKQKLLKGIPVRRMPVAA